MWTGIIIGGVVVAAAGAGVAYFIAAPTIRRKKAVKEALGKARAAAARDPEDPALQLDLARVYLQLGEHADDALRIVTAIRAREPQHWSGDKPAHMIEAEAHVALNDLPTAVKVFEAFVADVPSYDTGGDKEKKWRLDTHKVEAEQRIRLLARGDTHVHQPEQWGDAE